MTGKIRTSLLSLTIIAVIVFSAFGTTTVYADEGPPPDTEPTETTLPDEAGVETTGSTPAEGAVETLVIPDEAVPDTSGSADAGACSSEGADTDASGCSSDGVPAEVAGEGSAPVEETTDPQPADQAAPVAEEPVSSPDATVLDEVPDNTTVTVLDANGEAQPLATEAAAEAVATSDPIWCPQGAAPTPGVGGCTDSFTSFDDLLTALAANPTTYQGAGTIYIQQGAYQGGESSIDFNAYNLSNISSAPLTITGGWNTSTGAVDSTTPTTFNNTSIIIGSSTNPWGGSLTISNISMNFTPPQTSPPATPENGLTIYSQGSITVSNVSVMNAPSAGAEFDAGGDVNVINSKFDRNQTAGATIRSGSSVNVIDSSFSNPANGRRQDTGLEIQSAGSVTLLNVLANENRRAGTNINAGGAVTITGGVFSGTKLIQGDSFLGYGLQVVTTLVTATDAISLVNVTANDNFLWGASLDAPGGGIAISNSVFNANTTASPGFIDDTGLFINGGGTVALNNVDASDNRLFGAQIDAVGSVSINNSTFNNNRGTITTGGVTTDHGHGLQVTSLAGIFLTNVTATNNMLFGAQLNSGGAVDISFSEFSNTSTGSTANSVGKGLEIISAGNVSLTNVVLNNNQTVGADIQAGGNVSLNNVTATNNGSDGIILQGICAQVTGGTYSGNGQYGLNLGNAALDMVSSPTFANNGAGDLFPANPAICALLASNGTTTSTSSVGASNVFTSLQIAPQQSASALSSQRVGSVSETNFGSANLTLNSFIANIRTTASGIQLSIFMGKYTYVYSSSGLHIIAFSPSSDGIAMDGSYKAY